MNQVELGNLGENQSGNGESLFRRGKKYFLCVSSYTESVSRERVSL